MTQMVNKYRQHQVEMKTEKRKMRREEAVAIDKMHEERMIKDEQEFQVKDQLIQITRSHVTVILDKNIHLSHELWSE